MKAPPSGGAKLKFGKKAILTNADKDTKDHLNCITEQIKTGLANQFKK